LILDGNCNGFCIFGLDGRFWLDWCILQFGFANDFAALIPSVDISKSKSSSILLLLGLFQRRAGSEEVESLVGFEIDE
jgi:hypothetical protein